MRSQKIHFGGGFHPKGDFGIKWILVAIDRTKAVAEKNMRAESLRKSNQKCAQSRAQLQIKFGKNTHNLF